MASQKLGTVFALGAAHEELLAVGGDGWLLWRRLDAPDVRLRPGRSPEGRRVILEVHVSAQPALADRPLAPTDLRDVTLGRLEIFVNLPDVDGAVSDALNRKRPLGPCTGPGPSTTVLRRAAIPTTVENSLRLDVPAESRRSDEFYAEVARVFQIASQTSRRPAVDLAEANNVQNTTVHRWIREARRRGVMTPAGR